MLTSWRCASPSPALSLGMLQACHSWICHHGVTLALPRLLGEQQVGAADAQTLPRSMCFVSSSEKVCLG